MQPFLEAGTEIESGVMKVVDGDHLGGIGVDLAFQRAAVGRIDPVLDDSAVRVVDEELPAVDVERFVGTSNREFFDTDIVVGQVALVHLIGEGVEDGEAFAERFKLPVDIVGPALCVGTVVPILSSFDVPEAVDALSVVIGFVVAVLHISLVELAAHVVDGDEVIVGRRGELIGTREGLCGRFHWLFYDDGDLIRVKYGEVGYRFGVVVLTGGDDAAIAYGFGNDLDFLAEMNGLETDDLGAFDIVADGIAIFKRHPNNGVAKGHFEFSLICLLGCHKTCKAEHHKGKQRFFHDGMV